MDWTLCEIWEMVELNICEIWEMKGLNFLWDSRDDIGRIILWDLRHGETVLLWDWEMVGHNFFFLDLRDGRTGRFF